MNVPSLFLSSIRKQNGEFIQFVCTLQPLLGSAHSLLEILRKWSILSFHVLVGSHKLAMECTAVWFYYVNEVVVKSFA
jgi:hypothetical protein